MTQKKITQGAAVALIVGNLIGAGILGLPINTGLAGVWPSVLALCMGGALMFLSAIIIGDRTARDRSATFDYPSFYGTVLGKAGKWAAIAANLVILYGILTAYFSGGAKMLTSLLGMESHQPLVLLVFALPLVAVTCVNISFLNRLNALFVLIMILAFGMLILIGAGHVRLERMRYTDWAFLPATFPIIITAFHFHNIIPVVSSGLGWDRARFRKAVFWGMVVAFAMNGLWVLAAIGVMPLSGGNSILESWETNTPATVPMAAQLKSGLFTFCAFVFSLPAICTSFMANGLGLQNFIRDLMVNTIKVENRLVTILAAFVPPLLAALIYPNLFLTALDVVGGVGIIVLFGVLPMLIVVIDRSRSRRFRVLCLAGLAFALFILAVELMQECGLLSLKPWIEYHKTGL